MIGYTIRYYHTVLIYRYVSAQPPSSSFLFGPRTQMIISPNMVIQGCTLPKCQQSLALKKQLKHAKAASGHLMSSACEALWRITFLRLHVFVDVVRRSSQHVYISVMTAMAVPIAILPVLFCEPLTARLILCFVSDTVCDQERNYHIFFQLLQAREDPQLKDLGIGAPEVGSTLELANCSNESQEIRFWDPLTGIQLHQGLPILCTWYRWCTVFCGSEGGICQIVDIHHLQSRWHLPSHIRLSKGLPELPTFEWLAMYIDVQWSS